MFKKKSSDQSDMLLSQTPSPAFQPVAVRDALNKASDEKPYIYQQVTGRELHANVVEALSEETQGRSETALGIMGSLAGFSCLSAVYLKYERGEISPDEDGFRVEVTKSGRRIFFGDLINKKLFEDEMSVWKMVEATSKKLGALSLPDPVEISDHVEDTCHSEAYGQPRIAPQHQPRDFPSNFVRYLMPSYLPLLQKYDPNADKFPISFGFAIQNLMETSCDDLDPSTAARIVMECATSMASLDPAEVF